MSELFIFLGEHWILFAFWLIALMLVVMNELKRKVLGFKDVTPAEVVEYINKKDALVVDVRDEGEYQQGHIINAMHIPVALVDSRIGELESHRDRPIIVACRTGQRSARVGTILNKQGFNDVYKLGGGMMAWQSANLPLAK